VPIISPKIFVEGDKTNTSDIEKIDAEWTKVDGNLDASNIREEGLDRRVIKSSTWADPGKKPGQSYFYSSGFAEQKFPHNGAIDVHNSFISSGVVVPLFSKARGGMDDGTARISATWELNKTAAMIVRCSFRVEWNASYMGADENSPHGGYPDGWAEYYGHEEDPPLPYPIRELARSPMFFYLYRHERTINVDDGSVGTAPEGISKKLSQWSDVNPYANNKYVDRASVALSRLFASHGGRKGYYDAVTGYDGDLRSNVSVPVTLIDVVTPEMIWNNDESSFVRKHFEDGNNATFNFDWYLYFNHMFSNYSRSDLATLIEDKPHIFEVLPGVEIHDINFYVQKINR